MKLTLNDGSSIDILEFAYGPGIGTIPTEENLTDMKYTGVGLITAPNNTQDYVDSLTNQLTPDNINNIKITNNNPKNPFGHSLSFNQCTLVEYRAMQEYDAINIEFI